ncbi:hypothetical protein SI859A1_01191 [Aurantimonas manganoxydans SI85-9A1]|uniref:Usg protein n=2 Tax=Aurantimonas manganoxydans TaxID=651183 RepID=Q1YJC8_AURMS|nr:hypothetical protein SI859A1_01191 [Aurantimonas manganoxydans SI85-9A1]
MPGFNEALTIGAEHPGAGSCRPAQPRSLPMHTRNVDPQFENMLKGFGLTTAEVLYRMPDHPDFLQSFSWQFEDMAPSYPRLKRFLDHWDREIEAAIHSVRVMHAGLVRPREIRLVKDGGHLH